jgi:hypothetical protein
MAIEGVLTCSVDNFEANTEARRARIRAAEAKSECPVCGKHIGDGEGFGSGAKDEGLFCSVPCYAKFNEPTLRLRLSEMQTEEDESGE